MLGLTSDIKVKVVSENGCLHTLSVELPASKVKEKVEEAFKNVQGQAKLPGFRPGKAPIELVRDSFRGAAYEKAQDLLMRDGVFEALKSKKITPAQTPTVQNAAPFSPEKSFQFEFVVEALPSFKPSNYKGLKLTKRTKTVSDEDVQKALGNIADANARLTESKEETLKNTHYAVVDYIGLLGGKPIEGAKAENFLLDMSAPQAIAGLAEGLVGCKVAEEREVAVKFPADSPSAELASKEAVFKVKLSAIKEKSVPALDDEFAKDLGLKSLEELKTKIRENLEREQKQATQADLEKQVIEKLLEEHAFSVPVSMVEKQVQHLIQRQVSRLMNQGIAAADITKVVEQAKGELQKQAEKDVRLAYVLNAIAAEESIEALDLEVHTRIQEILSRSPEKDRAGLEKALRGKHNDQIRSEIRESKLFVWLIEHAKVKEG